jgi:hypothetical protein
VRIRCNREGAEDAESAVATGTAKWDEDLVEKPVESPLPRLLAPDSKSTSFASSYQPPIL